MATNGRPKDGELVSLMRGNPDDEGFENHHDDDGTADGAAGLVIESNNQDFDDEEQLGRDSHGRPRRSRLWFLTILILPALFLFIYTLRRRNFPATRTTEDDPKGLDTRAQSGSNSPSPSPEPWNNSSETKSKDSTANSTPLLEVVEENSPSPSAVSGSSSISETAPSAASETTRVPAVNGTSSESSLTETLGNNGAEQTNERTSPMISKCEREYTFNTSWEEYQTIVGDWNGSDRCSAELRPALYRNCNCMNPLKPTTQSMFLRKWEYAEKQNLRLINATKGKPLDVVMVGDSITEHWHGTDLGYPNRNYRENREVYESLFDKAKGASIQGLAVGIGGDRCGHLLYRLQNGEMPDFLQPTVWWVLIGTNDHGGEHCNDHIITIGVIRIAQEILARRPNATVVINSILPRGQSSLVDESYWPWQSLRRVNEHLECFANGTDNVEFFNGTDLFLTDDKTHLNLTLTYDDLHPSGLGSRIWGNAIVDRVQDIKSRLQQG